jgi:hypothetical protein
MKPNQCVLCGGVIADRGGCNPSPLATEGKCCHYCNANKVQPTRMWLAGMVRRVNGFDAESNEQTATVLMTLSAGIRDRIVNLQG